MNARSLNVYFLSFTLPFYLINQINHFPCNWFVYNQLITNKMPKITKQNFLQNKFSRSNTNKILEILNNFVDYSTSPSELSNTFLTQSTFSQKKLMSSVGMWVKILRTTSSIKMTLLLSSRSMTLLLLYGSPSTLSTLQ